LNDLPAKLQNIFKQAMLFAKKNKKNTETFTFLYLFATKSINSNKGRTRRASLE